MGGFFNPWLVYVTNDFYIYKRVFFATFEFKVTITKGDTVFICSMFMQRRRKEIIE
jgi:hypothetical protein